MEGPLAREERLSFDKLFEGSPLLMGPVCLSSQSRFEEPVRPCLLTNADNNPVCIVSFAEHQRRWKES